MTRPRSSDDEDNLRRLVMHWRRAGESWAHIAEYLEVSPKTIQTWAGRWGLVDPKRSENVKRGQRKRAERQGTIQCST